MATILLSAAGGAIGAGFGGSVLGLSGPVIGRAVGATVGRVIDQKLLGAGSRAVETGRLDRLRLTGASEGAPVGQVWGRMRLPGQVIWASRFVETVRRTGGGKGAPSPRVTEYSYSVSLAVALCEGEITRVGRVWADGREIAAQDLNLRVYPGSEDQLPDPKIAAVEGEGEAPAYRGTAYVVIEDLALGAFGNRVPQFSFEVVRAVQDRGGTPNLTQGVKAVALVPGTGEYALATTPVYVRKGLAETAAVNMHRPGSRTDFEQSLGALGEELPACGSVSLVVSWFGDDLRCGQCRVRPKVETAQYDAAGMPWQAGGIARAAAQEVVRIDGRPAYGGTPADASVIEAIGAAKRAGKAVMLYPFLLMEQIAGNGRADPWRPGREQPSFPWRGRITSSVAPGLAGSPDRSVAAEAEVAAFFGTAAAGDFQTQAGMIVYSGPDEWSYRRFILHYAHVCAAAGGVDAFCIGSEMRGLTQVRGAGDGFPAVQALRQLAADVRLVLGTGAKIGYAADWSEYSGYQDGEGNRYFHLDPLWADPNADFVGIDNYMPLSDWREGDAHLDSGWGSVYDLGYLQAGIEGGEGYDWYYAQPEHRLSQIRTPITDGQYGEPWVWRYKDIRNWWDNSHHERLGGVRQPVPTAWIPRSKPIWFTEFGCPAVDKGTNEPNRFIDAKSSESRLPHFSDGRRDDLIQMQYLRAILSYWSDPGRNPVSDRYAGRMIDMDRAHVWAWDTRPFPEFPARGELWSDAVNYRTGHWVSGRTSSQPLAGVVSEIAGRSGLMPDVSRLYGLVRGYSVADVTTGRAAIQPLMLAYGFDATERDGEVQFRQRGLGGTTEVTADMTALDEIADGKVELTRAAAAEISGRVRLGYVEAERDFAARIAEAVFPGEDPVSVAASEMSLSLLTAEARGIAERWLAQARVARDTTRFALPPSMGWIGAGDIVRLAGGSGHTYRIDRVEQAGALSVEAVRLERSAQDASPEAEEPAPLPAFVPAAPVEAVFLDLPLITGQEVEQAPHLAVAANPWPGTVAVYASADDSGYVLNRTLLSPSLIGVTETALAYQAAGIWDRGPALRVRLPRGTILSVDRARLLNGANLIAIGDGSNDRWEVFQFRDAALVSDGVYDLSHRLRGQAGTEWVAPGGWPAGSLVVLLDGAPQQIGLTLAERDLARNYRIGAARLDPSDPSYVQRSEAFAGMGLRPYAPAHLRAAGTPGGDRTVSWIRRTRIGGDGWSGLDVPLGEASEAYVVRVLAGGAIVREAVATGLRWIYPAADRVADGVVAPYEIAVAQVSEVFGTGAFVRITIND